MTDGAVLLLKFFGVLAFISLVLLVLSLTSVLPLSTLWILSPVWGFLLFAWAVGLSVNIVKYFRFQYWK